MMILILGGARSGKSRLAVGMAKRQCKKAAYIATGPLCDDEMRLRARLHKKSRPGGWITIEPPADITPYLRKIPKTCDGIIIECIATYVSNLMLAGLGDAAIIKNIKKMLHILAGSDKKVFIVSNEVGGGLVPETADGRRFRDLVGRANQIIAGRAKEVYLVIAGLETRLK